MNDCSITSGLCTVKNTVVVIITIIHSSQVLNNWKNVGFFLKMNTEPYPKKENNSVQ